MVTGYTHELVEKDLSFNDFAILCCRAMGVCVTMRDDPQGTPIPKEFEPSTYNLEQIKVAEATIEKLEAMDPDQKGAYGKKQVCSRISYHTESLTKATDANEKYETMLEEIKAWEVPSEDHQGVKDFMIQQVTMSMNDLSYYEDNIKNLKTRNFVEEYNADLKQAYEDVAYHKNGHKEEVKRVTGRNLWLKKMRESLKVQ